MCGCPEGWGCIFGDETGTLISICVNNSAACLPGVTQCEYIEGFSRCLVGETDALCFPSASGDDPVCTVYPDTFTNCLTDCQTDADCGVYGLDGDVVCVQACDFCGGDRNRSICVARA